MAPKYLTLMLFLWIGAAIMGATMEGQQIGLVDGEAQTALDQVMIWKNVKFEDISDTFSVVGATGTFFSGLFNLMFFNFAFLEGNVYADVFRWVVLGPVLIAVIWGVIVTVIGVFSRVFSF
jgi:hypothetical protein